MSLTIYHTDDIPFTLMQSDWSTELNPIIANPLTKGILLKDVALISGVTVINHKLARVQQGWIVTDQNGSAEIYRSKPLSPQTLTLTSSAAVIVSLYVF